MERIDLSQSGVLAGMPGAIVTLAELFSPRVLRHFLPVIAGVWLAYGAATRLVQTLYDLPDETAARQFLQRLRAGRRMIYEQPLALRAHMVEEVRHQLPLLRVGGPGIVLVRPGEVAVTEFGGRAFRVLPPGVYSLARFEYVHTVLDLREHDQRIPDIALVTRDGIEVRADVNISYRISQGSEPPTRARPYPYDELAVKTAAYDQTVVAPHTVTNWESTPLNVTRGELKKIIAKLSLDEILQPDDSVDEPHLVIRNELERRTRLILADRGIDLVSLHIGRLQFPAAVTEQYIKYWQAQWEIKADLSLAEGDATALEEIEVARAEAEVTMIQAIVEGVRRVQQDGRTSTVREIVAMRLIEAMEKLARQSQKLEPLPKDLLSRLTQMRRDLLSTPIEGRPREEPPDDE
jgi:regulator of protease activity HflC (stomatin/prohibitin superfamily)